MEEGAGMTRDQKIVAIGAASGVVSMALATWLLSGVLPALAGMDSVADRLAYALRWDAFAGLPLFFMLAAVGNARSSSFARIAFFRSAIGSMRSTAPSVSPRPPI
jgi:hypothetical protein